MNARPDAEKRVARIVLADATPKVRSALKLLLEQYEAMTVNTAVASARGLMEQVRVSCPEKLLEVLRVSLEAARTGAAPCPADELRQTPS